MEDDNPMDHTADHAPGAELSDEDLLKVAGGTGDLTEEMSLRLQTLMDRRAKIYSTLSNTLKVMQSSAESTIANLK
jgi:hypothetical protein